MARVKTTSSPTKAGLVLAEERIHGHPVPSALNVLGDPSSTYGRAIVAAGLASTSEIGEIKNLGQEDPAAYIKHGLASLHEDDESSAMWRWHGTGAAQHFLLIGLNVLRGFSDPDDTASTTRSDSRPLLGDVFEKRLALYQGGADAFPAVDQEIIQRVKAFAENVRMYVTPYDPSVTTDDEGGLSVEVRLTDSEELFVDVDADAKVQAFILRADGEFVPLKSKGLDRLVAEILFRER